MVDSIKLYFKYFSVQFRSQLQDRTSFLFLCLSQAILTLTGIIALLAIVDEQTSIGGYTRDEILFLYAIVLLAFALAEAFFRGFDSFANLLGNGLFDRMLVRPRNLILQILGQTIELSRLGRVVVAVATMLYYKQSVEIQSTLVLTSMVVSGTLLFACLYVIQSAICFFTTQSLELMNIFTDGAREFSKIPFALYGKPILFILTFIVPLALVQYYPSLILFGKSDQLLYAFTPLLSLLFVLPTIAMWSIGRSRYKSIGS